MLGAGLQFNRIRGEDRLHNPVKARRSHIQSPNQQNQHLQRANSEGSSKEEYVVPANREPENRVGSTELQKAVATPAVEPAIPPLSNLKRFLDSVTPSVPAQYLSKTTMRGLRTCDVEYQPYFELGDLWESFKEWSAYGVGVPLVLNDSDSVVQYYVPFLSGIQIYGDTLKPSLKSRRPDEDSDGDSYRDSSSDISSDSETERGLRHHYPLGATAIAMDRLSLSDQHLALQEGFSSDDGESGNPHGCLVFEYLESDPPYSREPLADKILDLAFRFPELRTLKSCDLLPSSWISVAWYPIYRIPTGPTLRDLDACFLTFHSLHTPLGGTPSPHGPRVTYPSETDGVPQISLTAFGLASYKFKGSLWTPNGGCDRQLFNSLLHSAEKWLGLLRVDHPDFLFFCHR